MCRCADSVLFATSIACSISLPTNQISTPTHSQHSRVSSSYHTVCNTNLGISKHGKRCDTRRALHHANRKRGLRRVGAVVQTIHQVLQVLTSRRAIPQNIRAHPQSRERLVWLSLARLGEPEEVVRACALLPNANTMGRGAAHAFQWYVETPDVHSILPSP